MRKNVYQQTIKLFFIGIFFAGCLPGPQSITKQKGHRTNAKYMGMNACGICHGKELVKWESTAHAHAFKTLGNPKAKEIALKLNIEDPQKSKKCLKCHATGGGVSKTSYGPEFRMENGVQCESCHNAGELYRMEMGKGRKEFVFEEAEKKGLHLPDDERCIQCHNSESPTFKEEFDFGEMFAKIEHEKSVY